MVKLNLIDKMLLDLYQGRGTRLVNEAHRFFIDKDTSKTVMNFNDTVISDADFSIFLSYIRPPFDCMWIEWEFQSQVGCFIETTKNEKVIEVCFVHSPPSGAFIIIPIDVHLNDVGYSAYASEAVEEYLRSIKGIKTFLEICLHFLVAVLILLNQKNYVIQEPYNRPPRVRNGFKSADHPITNISLQIPREFIISEDGSNSPAIQCQKNSGPSTRMQYEVMGSWHQHKPNDLQITCNHEFIHEAESLRRRRCIHCNKLAWWVKPHCRGNAELGIMAKDRLLKKKQKNG